MYTVLENPGKCVDVYLITLQNYAPNCVCVKLNAETYRAICI